MNFVPGYIVPVVIERETRHLRSIEIKLYISKYHKMIISGTKRKPAKYEKHRSYSYRLFIFNFQETLLRIHNLLRDLARKFQHIARQEAEFELAHQFSSDFYLVSRVLDAVATKLGHLLRKRGLSLKRRPEVAFKQIRSVTVRRRRHYYALMYGIYLTEELQRLFVESIDL